MAPTTVVLPSNIITVLQNIGPKLDCLGSFDKPGKQLHSICDFPMSLHFLCLYTTSCDSNGVLFHGGLLTDSSLERKCRRKQHNKAVLQELSIPGNGRGNEQCPVQLTIYTGSCNIQLNSILYFQSVFLQGRYKCIVLAFLHFVRKDEIF